MAILALDQGTTSSRAILFDRSLQPIATASVPLTQYYPNEGWVEHDPLEIFAGQMQAAREAIDRSGEQVDCIGIANQRETTILWDRSTGLPVAPAIVWQCRRTADICEALEADGWAEKIKAITGLQIDAYFSATKIKWLLEHCEAAKKAYARGDLLFGTVESWLIWKLTGEHKTDVTNASRTMLMDLETQQWSGEICEKLGIPIEILPEICENEHEFGRVKPSEEIPEAMWNVPVTAAVGDQQAALFGQACFEAGDSKNTYGTGCFVLMNTGDEAVRSEKLVSTVAWERGGRATYALEGSVFNAGSAIQWLRDELHLISSAHECDILAESVEHSGGVRFVSAFTGLGAPYWDMYARGALLGVTRGTARGHICRAVLEGIAFQSAELVREMESASGRAITTLRVDGGVSVSDLMLQLQADLIGKTVDRPIVKESTALGAAMLAGLGAGLFALDELKAIRRSDKCFEPNADSDTEALFASWRRAVKAVQAFEE